MALSFPSHGILGKAYTFTRLLQIAVLITTIGLTAKFISQMIEATTFPPAAFVAILAISCLSLIYTVITLILYFDNTLPLLVTCVSDLALTATLLVLSILIGKPLSFLSCTKVGHYAPLSFQTLYPEEILYPTNPGQASSASDAYNIAPASAQIPEKHVTVAYKYNNDGTVEEVRGVNYGAFAGGNQAVCELMKGAWGLGIALTIGFLVSAFCAGWIWKTTRGQSKKGEKLEEIA
ncbi:hypothetical protein BJ508DRAFT_164676 [Ascobolus immersus RN42]|uniref:MARVEL domain-containing protein n=1 Tax=Ascobolus immersus RN42 TaxID=1160509 RepID=A0A3N4I0Z4_ASCIM|nr:hypothetical protein BJ508DRAFT_164676 [Ascobolus immersus RN42]